MRRFWGLAAVLVAVCAMAQTAEARVKKICNTWTGACWFETEDGQVVRRVHRTSERKRQHHHHKRRRKPEVRAYVRREEDDGVHCKPTVRVVGDARPTENGAREDAEAAWMRETRWKFGAMYISLPSAKKYQIRCGRDSITEFAGAVMVRCELMAQPCNVPFESR